MGGGPGDDVVAEDADALDLGLDVVAGLEVELEQVGLDRGHASDVDGIVRRSVEFLRSLG